MPLGTSTVSPGPSVSGVSSAARRSSPALAEETAFRNGTLQGAYLTMAAKLVGLDVGSMSGFDKAKVNAAFFGGTTWTVNFLVNLGHGDPAKVFGRLPRLAFAEACTLA